MSATNMTSLLLWPISPEDSIIVMQTDDLWQDTFRQSVFNSELRKPVFLLQAALILITHRLFLN